MGDIARGAYEALAADERFEVPWAPDLSVVAFRLAGGDDAAQRRLLDRINATRRVFLSSTRLQGRFYLRIAILSFRTHGDRIRELLEIVSREVDAVGGGSSSHRASPPPTPPPRGRARSR